MYPGGIPLKLDRQAMGRQWSVTITESVARGRCRIDPPLLGRLPRTMLLRRLIRRISESLFTVPIAIIAGCVGAAALTL